MPRRVSTPTLLSQACVPPGGGGTPFTWSIRGRAAGKVNVFGLCVLNRVNNSVQVCPKQGLNLSLTGYGH